MASKPTLIDLARAAGISIATVDRVVNRRGGVSAEREARVLDVARRIGLDRAIRISPTRTLRVAVLIQPPRNPFHAALRNGIAEAARSRREANVQFAVEHIDQGAPQRIADQVTAASRSADALIVSVPDDAVVAEALSGARDRVPVVALATDVGEAARTVYVGTDEYRSGRAAGDLFGRLMGPGGGDVVAVVGLSGLAGQRKRVDGVRAVLAERYPEVRLAAVLECGEIAERAGDLVHARLKAGDPLDALYLASTGAGAVVDALRAAGRLETTVVVAHELTPDRRALLRARAIDAVIDQRPELGARLAAEAALSLLGRLEAPVPHATEIAIHMAENA